MIWGVMGHHYRYQLLSYTAELLQGCLRSYLGFSTCTKWFPDVEVPVLFSAVYLLLPLLPSKPRVLLSPAHIRINTSTR